MVPVVLQVANTIAARAIWPPDNVVPRLRDGDLTLHIRRRLLRLGQGQPQIRDIAKAIGPADLPEARAEIPTLGAGLDQRQNPCHAPTPGPKSGAKLPNPSRPPSFAAVPHPSQLIADSIVFFETSRLCVRNPLAFGGNFWGSSLHAHIVINRSCHRMLRPIAWLQSGQLRQRLVLTWAYIIAETLGADKKCNLNRKVLARKKLRAIG